ncbi:MAG: hypothetical protein R2864_06225 [Syntrophotaleaceae bacterium]
MARSVHGPHYPFPQVNEKAGSQGVKVVERVEDIEAGTVIIRSTASQPASWRISTPGVWFCRRYLPLCQEGSGLRRPAVARKGIRWCWWVKDHPEVQGVISCTRAEVTVVAEHQQGPEPAGSG